MISDLHFKNLDTANRELSRRFEKLRKARASRDANGIKNAEIEYFQSLQHLYTAVQDAVADWHCSSPRRIPINAEIVEVFKKYGDELAKHLESMK